MTRVDWGWVAAITAIVWPFAYCALHAIRCAGRAITNSNRNQRTR